MHHEAELLERVAQRDREALEVLYDRHAPVALAVAVQTLGDPIVSETIVGEAFWLVWQRAAYLHMQSNSFQVLICRIVHYLATQHLNMEQSNGRGARRQG